MPTFTWQVPSLRGTGPIIDVQLAISGPGEQALRAAGAPVPSPVGMQALIDTGASSTVIRRGLAELLGLNPVGSRLISTPSHTNVECTEYHVRLIFPNQGMWQGTVIEAPLEGQVIEGLIGRDILELATLVYIGPANLISLSF